MGINIGFDADGVLFDTEWFQLSKNVETFMKEEYGLEIVNPNGYGIKDVYNCSSEIEMDFWTKFVIKYSIFFKPRPWVKETIDALRREGNKVYIITSKACALEKNYKGVAVRLLFELGLKLNGIIVDGIEYCELDNSPESKLNACRKLSVKVIIEDKSENIEKLSEEICVLCMDTLNNQKSFNHNVIRVNDFNDVYFEIENIISNQKSEISIFENFKKLSKEERNLLEGEELEVYYDNLMKYFQTLPFDKKIMDKREKIIKFIADLYLPIFNFKYNPTIIGKENLPKEKGCIYVCNHLCDKDMLFLLCELKDYFNAWHPLIKMEILNEKSGFLFRLAKSNFVDRQNSKSRSCATTDMGKMIVNGYNVLIFPEGTYNKTTENLKEFQGVSHLYLSQVLKAPIVNMALTDNYIDGPILRIDKPYIVPRQMSIGMAKEESFNRLSDLVEKNKMLIKES